METTNVIGPTFLGAFKEIDKSQIGVEGNTKEILSTFHIFHTVDKKTSFEEVEHQPRKYIGSVLAKDIDHAYKMAQNDFNPEYEKFKVRSTSVGDLIQDDYGYYMVCNQGFKLICLVDDEGGE